jgi:3-methyladenine DNA glycosylase AlkD
MHREHKEILTTIKERSGKATAFTASDAYLGTSHPRYPINVPTMRSLAKEWIRKNADMEVKTFSAVLTSLIQGKSCTEKLVAGLMLNLAKGDLRAIDPLLLVKWLDHLEGWVEIDTLCTGNFAAVELPRRWSVWKKIVNNLSRSPNINKRRASLVLFCTPLRKNDDQSLLQAALKNIDRLKGEKAVIITKAISWVLRCGVVHNKAAIKKYVDLNENTLPKIAVRETRMLITTGRKTKPKKK